VKTSPAGWARIVLTALVAMTMPACSSANQTDADGAASAAEAIQGPIRVATYNIWQLSAAKVDSVDAEGRGAHPQLLAAARVIKRVKPDILVLNEVDLALTPEGTLDEADMGRVVRHFVERYLAVGDDPLDFAFVYTAPSNTGELSGLDLNRDGITGTLADLGTRAYGDDSWGYGEYPGQYAMAVLSRFAIDAEGARSFRRLRWVELPDHHLPRDCYGPVADSLRLSSKSHWDVPVQLGTQTLHLLVSHPTPTGFDGDEDRNGLRNYDEIGLWARYLDDAEGLTDDRGMPGGLQASGAGDASASGDSEASGAGRPLFVIAGDLNAAPDDEPTAVDPKPAILQLLEHRLVQDPAPLQGQTTFGGFGRWSGSRIDYVLPSIDLDISGAGLVGPEDPDADVGSDHYLVWVDLHLPG